MEKNKLVFDGENAILGRLGSHVAKNLLKGYKVVVFNSEKVLISGSKEDIIGSIIAWRRKARVSSQKGPFISRMADRLLKRMFRGMLPWDRPKGRDAYKRLKCYVGTAPREDLTVEEIKSAVKLKFDVPQRYITLKQVAEALH
jgi:large subunit ribosomal protein L13